MITTQNDVTKVRDCSFKTNTLRRMRDNFNGHVEIDGMTVHAFVGYVMIVRTWNGYRFGVDRWGGVWSLRHNGELDGLLFDGIGRGYAPGIKWVVDWSVNAKG